MLNVGLANYGFLVFSALYRSDIHTSSSLSDLIQGTFGNFANLSPRFNPLKDYYSKEMGESELLNRTIYCCLTPFPRDYLLSTKLLALEWERKSSQMECRTVNVDVGFLTLENFILATTKNFSHRVYLGHNIFADLTYQFTQGRLTPLPWCYPDYQDPEKIEFFTWCRGLLLS
jgi:hypothetical protein